MIRRAALLLFAFGLPFVSVQAQTDTPVPPTATLPYCATAIPYTSTPYPTYQDKVLGYAPDAYWALDETAGTVAIDLTGGGRHGTYSGATLNATTFLNGDPAPSFDGVNDYISTPGTMSALYSTSSGFISGWFKVASYAGSSHFFSLRSTDFVRARTATTPGILYVGGTASETISYSSTAWTHVAIGWDSTTMYYYLNGSLQLSEAGTISGSFVSFVMGAQTTGQGFLAGNIAHIAFWDTFTLSSSDIADLAVVPSGSPPTPTPTPSCQMFNPTATPTFDFNIYFTTPAGEHARVERTITAGDLAIFAAFVLFVLCGWAVYASHKLGGGQNR